jgi:hypothetical protein
MERGSFGEDVEDMYHSFRKGIELVSGLWVRA